MPRVLLLATTTGYQTRMFETAAARLGVEIVYATDRCDRLDDPWRDHAVAVRFRDEARGSAALVAALAGRPVDGVLAVGDRPTVMAAYVQQRLGLPGHPAAAADIARDKRLMRARIREAGLPAPATAILPPGADPLSLPDRPPFPVVVKPTTLSGSRGVIRADDEAAFVEAVARVRRLLRSPEVRAAGEDAIGPVQVEAYIDGAEYAVEGLMEHGVLRVLAIFDKPDPLVGPYFEETIYVTPSLAGAAVEQAITRTVAAAAGAVGLHHGPVHAECRATSDGVYLLEVAARPIGGLCAGALRFQRADAVIGLEELLLRHALGEPSAPWTREAEASGVMMIPIPRSGVLRRVDGQEEARAVAGITGLTITARADQRLVALPEGATYLGFIFARGPHPDAVAEALRTAHGILHVAIDVDMPVLR